MLQANEIRPSPDALLEQASKEGRGRLKLFLGAAPGVGKTYEMLVEAHAKKSERVDVVIGVVEHHGRAETRHLLLGFEIIPRRQINYRGQIHKEMDIDAILKRRPKLVLVDELAHTNIEGSRHPKRWMDVQELLAAGIDVFSTMNVQHLESANDIVAKITQVQVRETVPDSLLSLADEIEVVDVTPEELQQRMRDGKVYPEEAAQRALANFFTLSNITALRELALRRAADRVDDSLRAHMAAQGITGPWEANERVLACIDPTPAALGLVRRAKRLADRLHAPWEAIHVATPESERSPRAARGALLDAFRLAEELGAKTRSLNGDDPAEEILAYARAQNITHIVVGSSTRPLWIEAFRGSIIRRLVRGAQGIAVEIYPREDRFPGGAVFSKLRPPPFGDPGGYAVSLVFTAIAAAFAATLNSLVDLPNISLVFVLAVIASAIRFGVATSIFTAVMCALAYNFFLIPPLYTFTIADPSNIYANVFFIAVAAAVSGVAARTRAQTLIARQQARQAADFEDFARSLVGAESESDIAASTAETAAKLLTAHVVVLSSSSGDLEPAGEAPGPEILSLDDFAAAKWAFTSGRAAGWGSDTLGGARWLFIPIPGERGLAGVIGVRPDDDSVRLDPNQRRTLDLVALQAGVAMDRARLAGMAADARIEAESERLKGTLLSAVSHDLRTPLSAIRASVESLLQYEDRMDAVSKRDLLSSALSETEKLSRFVQGLLDMTRLDSGVVRPMRQAAEVGDLVNVALERVNSVLADKKVTRDVSSGLPRVLVDTALTESALANILENAGKYAPSDSAILVRAYRADGGVAIEILDEGPGFPEASLPLLFEKFSRGVETDGRAPGTGLGLAIAKGFLSVQGAKIEAGNRLDHSGARVCILLPLEEN